MFGNNGHYSKAAHTFKILENFKIIWLKYKCLISQNFDASKFIYCYFER